MAFDEIQRFFQPPVLEVGVWAVECVEDACHLAGPGGGVGDRCRIGAQGRRDEEQQPQSDKKQRA